MTKKNFTANDTNICYTTYKHDNIKTLNNKQLTYICETKDSQIGFSDPPLLAGSSTPINWSISDYYRDATKKMSQSNKLFHIDCCLTGRTGKYDNRRSLNIDIVLEPNTKPFKYICKMASYINKHGVYQNIPKGTANWPGWQFSKQLYTEHKHSAMFGKFTYRTRNTKSLPRQNVPCCVGGITEEGAKTFAHLLIFDLYYKIPLYDINSKQGEAYKFFTKRGSLTTPWEEPAEYSDEEITNILGNRYE